MMTSFHVLILLCLGVVFPCKGKINLPPGGNRLIFAIGSTAEIEWSYNPDFIALFRVWYFKNGTKEQKILSINDMGVTNKDQSPFPDSKIKSQATLVLKTVDHRYNGVYKFSLSTQSNGSPNSEVEVIIAVKPKVTVNCSERTTVKKGEDIICTCKGVGGNPPANVTWYKDEKKCSETGKEKQDLTLINVDKNDRGKYRCLAFGHELAKDETTIELIVQYPPEDVRVVLPSEMAERGKPFVIKCEAEANPLPEFKIFLNETEMPTIGDTHTIREVNERHVGFYKCVAKNKFGSSNSTSIYLSVGDAETQGDDDGGLGTGAIVGIVIGVLVFVLIIVLVYLFVFKKKNNDHERVRSESNRAKDQPPEQLKYAALDQKALKRGAGGKPASTSTPTEYAAIQVS